MLKLHTRKSIVKKRKRIGRGGERGGTSGRGHKGQKARSGALIGPVFEGGQMPLTRRLPKRGFNNAAFQSESVVINLKTLQQFFAADAVVDLAALREKGFLRGEKSKGAYRVKVLGDGKLDKKLQVHAHAFSASAQSAIQAVGGEAVLIQE